MKANMTTLQEAAELEAAVEKLVERQTVARLKLPEKQAAARRELLAEYSDAAVDLWNRLQSEKAKAAEGKAT